VKEMIIRWTLCNCNDRYLCKSTHPEDVHAKKEDIRRYYS